jgi:transcriptional regulator
MLLPKIYQIDDPKEIQSFITQFSFATVISNMNAAHVPLQYDPDRSLLTGHMTVGNPVLVGIESTKKALAIFQGPHGYISSSWYIDQSIPPTWNFTAVHALGTARILDRDRDKLRILKETVDHFEARNGTEWSFDTEDPQIRSMLPLIAGFEIQIESLQCCYKLSQNRAAADFESAVRHLEAKNDVESLTLARWMRKKVKI